MVRLPHHTHQVIHDALRELYAQTDLGCLRETMVRAAARLVPCEMGSYNEIIRAEGRPTISLRFPDSADWLKYVPAFRAFYGEHPVNRYNHETGSTDTRKFSDFMTARELGRLRLYNEYYREIGVRHQMVLWFDRGGPTQHAISLNRTRRDFSEQDRCVLDLLRPHYAQAYENTANLTRLRVATAAMAQVQADRAQAMLLVDRESRVQWFSHQARRWLRDFSDAELDTGSALPEVFFRWLASERAGRCDAGRALVASPSPLRFSKPQGSLSVRFAAEDSEGNVTLLLTFENPSAPVAPLRVSGLTRRENEVLGWIAQGKSNPDIAVILGLSVRTIYKHVENIFPKLGVDNRAAAMLHVLSLTGQALSERGCARTG